MRSVLAMISPDFRFGSTRLLSLFFVTRDPISRSAHSVAAARTINKVVTTARTNPMAPAMYKPGRRLPASF